ncbi:uncharacterized protein L969DRAFT_85855 [Mixia osmundae IAM 14324]|nr:uncharacterized protein L969DRAFT_85855 [Mixia osmundae IAM 14324]KEI40642.1 hypothetical protein L969DRAFT_85855 [Mixia osmundae IAM 14324]
MADSKELEHSLSETPVQDAASAMNGLSLDTVSTNDPAAPQAAQNGDSEVTEGGSSAKAKKKKRQKLAARAKAKMESILQSTSHFDQDDTAANGDATSASTSAQGTSTSPSNKGGEREGAVGSDGKVKMSERQLTEMMMREIRKHPEAAHLSPEQLMQLASQLNAKDVIQGRSGLGGKNRKDMGTHKFWATQPVPQLGKTPEKFEEGVIEEDETYTNVRKEPYPLPKDYEWVTMDLTQSTQCQEVYELLTHHYVEDDDAMFRFDYSNDFIQWALKPPGYIADHHVGVRVTATRKLVAFITGIPLNLRVRKLSRFCTEINFLCIHKMLRSKRLAPLLIKEITRRCHLIGIYQAIYTAGVFLPTPVATSQYYHRSLNPKHLIEVGFSALPRHSTMARVIKQYELPQNTSLQGLREIESGDVHSVALLLRQYMARFDVAPLFTNEEIEHNFLNSKGSGPLVSGKRKGQVTWTYVVQDPQSGEITDMFSFYTLPSTAMRTDPPSCVNAAYLYYYASHQVPTGEGASWESENLSDRTRLRLRLTALVTDALIIARNAHFDVFNALTLMDNNLFIHDLKFGAGDGFLNYYLYNWRAHAIAGGCRPPEGRGIEAKSASAIPELGGKPNGSGVGVVML